MANDKKMVEAITSMDEDFAQWYTDVVLKAGLIAYTNVKGCMAIKPAGYAIWELIQKQLDERFKATGVENVYREQARQFIQKPDRSRQVSRLLTT